MTHPAAPPPRPDARGGPRPVPPAAVPSPAARPLPAAAAAPSDPGPGPSAAPPALALRGLWKRFGDKVAVAGVDLDVPTGSFYGLVGPNGAGKTTTLSMATGLLRPDAGSVWVHGRSLWADPTAAKRTLGVLPDGMRLFDRLTGTQLLTYAGLLRGMDRDTVAERTGDLLRALDLADEADTLVVDYSAGMTKKVALAS